MRPRISRFGWAVAVGVLAASLIVPSGIALQNLTGLHISATSQRAGDTETWKISFQNPVAADLTNYRLKWTVPDGFVLNNPVCSYDGDGGVVTTVNGQTVTCRLTGEGFTGQGATLVFHIASVRAPTSQQTTPHFTTQWVNDVGVTIATDDEYTTQILSNFLTSVSASMADRQTGAVTDLSLVFSTKNPVAANGDVRFVLPADFELRSNAGCSINGLSGLTFTRVSAAEGVCNLNTATLTGGTAYTLAVSGVKNALYAKTYQVPTLETRTATDALHDTATNIGFSLDPRHFAQTPKATPGSNVSGDVTTWTVEGKLSNPLPANDFVAVTFPTGFRFNQNGTTALEIVSGTSAHFRTAVISGQTVAAQLADGVSLDAGTLLKFIVSHVQNLPWPADQRRGDPNATQTIEVALATANDAVGSLQGIKDLVQGILLQPPPPPCDPETEGCCETDPADCDDSGCADHPTSASCCDEGENCPTPPPPTCTQLGNCPTSPVASPSSTPSPLDNGGTGSGGTKIFNFFAADGPMGESSRFVAGILAFLLLGGLGAGGYYGYRFLHEQTAKAGVPTAKPKVPPFGKLKP